MASSRITGATMIGLTPDFVAAAGKNDCATSKHSCAGMSTVDKAPDDYKNILAGTCEKNRRQPEAEGELNTEFDFATECHEVREPDPRHSGDRAA